MELYKENTYEAMSEAASEYLLSRLKEKPDSLFCLATGSSPTETYRLFVQKALQQKLDTSRLRIIKLDEWYGLPQNHPATCEYYIRKHILEPLRISEDRYISFQSMEQDPESECARISHLISLNHGIDCCVLGIGKNGHLGLNEPSSAINPFIHKALLSAKTKEHSMLTDHNQSVTEGYTLGIKEILDSRSVVLLVTGTDKQEVWEHFLTGTISSFCPATYLWLHNDTHCFIDLSSF